VLSFSHETKNGENHKTSEKTRATVDDSHYYCIPGTYPHRYTDIGRDTKRETNRYRQRETQTDSWLSKNGMA